MASEFCFESGLTSLSLSPSQTIAAVGSRVGGALVRIAFKPDYDEKPSVVLERELSRKPVSDVAMNPKIENVLAMASARRVVELWDYVACTSRPLFEIDRAAVTRLSWQSTDPNMLLVGCTDGLLRLCDIRLENPVHKIMAPRSKEIRDCQFDPHDNCTLAACFDNGTVQTFDSRQPTQCARKLFVHDSPCLCLAYSPERRGVLACGGSAGSSFAANAFQQTLKLKVIAPEKDTFLVRAIRSPGIGCLAWSEENYLGGGLDSKFDHDVCLWNIDDPFFSPQARFGPSEAPIARFAFLNLPESDAFTHTKEERISSAEERMEDSRMHRNAQRKHVTLITASKDGRVAIHEGEQQQFLLPTKGHTFTFASSEAVVSTDCISPTWYPHYAQSNRGLGKAKFLSDLGVHGGGPLTYKLSGFESLNDACEWNQKVCENAGLLRPASFWATTMTLFGPIAARQASNSESTHEGGESVETLVDEQESILESKDDETPFAVTEISEVGSSLLQSLSALDPHLFGPFNPSTTVNSSMPFRSRIPAFVKMSSTFAAELGLVPPHQNASETNALDVAKPPPMVIIPSREFAEPDLDDGERFDCLKEAIYQLVDVEGDVQTALASVLVLANLGWGPIFPEFDLKRWSIAVQGIFEAHCMFPQALEVALETSKWIGTQTPAGATSEGEQESRVAMACGNCGEPLWRLTEEGACTECKTVVVNCAVCRVKVQGQYAICLLCGHGGHVHHLQEWFKVSAECPTGCGCQCYVA